MPDQDNPEDRQEEREGTLSLVPLYSPLDVRKGLQAYRRGDVILYTIRGEPEKVQELIGELDERGVTEIVALVSHHAQPEGEEGEEIVDVEPADRGSDRED